MVSSIFLLFAIQPVWYVACAPCYYKAELNKHCEYYAHVKCRMVIKRSFAMAQETLFDKLTQDPVPEHTQNVKPHLILIFFG